MPQRRRHSLAFLARVDENQALLPARVLENVAHPRVGLLGHNVGRRFGNRQRAGRRFAVPARLRAGNVEMLHRQPPARALALELGNHGAPPRPGREEAPRALRVADGRRQTDAPRIDARQLGQPFNQTERLPAAVAAHQRVHLVDDDEAQVAEQAHEVHMLVQQQRLERLGRDLQDAGGVFEQLGLVRLRHVAVPVPDGDVRLGAEVVQPCKLVVDERLQRADVDGAHRARRVLRKQGEDGEEGRLRLARRGRGGEQHVLVGVEDGVARRDLNGPQRFPAAAVNEILYKGRVALENAHRLSSRLTVQIRRRLPPPAPLPQAAAARTRTTRSAAAPRRRSADSGTRCSAAR